MLDKELTAVSDDAAGAYVLGSPTVRRQAPTCWSGADGLKSPVRREVFAEPAPEFSGFVAWRGLVTRTNWAPNSPAPAPWCSWRRGGCLFATPCATDGYRISWRFRRLMKAGRLKAGRRPAISIPCEKCFRTSTTTRASC